MIEFTIGGRRIRPEDFGKELEKQAAEQIAQSLHDRLSSICTTALTNAYSRSKDEQWLRLRVDELCPENLPLLHLRR